MACARHRLSINPGPGYDVAMSLEATHGATADRPDAQAALDRSPGTLSEAIALHRIEGNPLDAGDIAMFEMFEREKWSPERCRAYIVAEAKRVSAAAE